MDFESDIKAFLTELKAVKKDLSAIKTKGGQVNPKKLRSKIESLSKAWFVNFKKALVDSYGFEESSDVVQKRDKAFTHLLHLSSSHGNKKSQYLKDINNTTSKFQVEIISPLQTKGTQTVTPISGAFDDLLKKVTNSEQSEYLSEAIACARAGYLKASVVLGWCACIDHIHKKIDNMGYPTFNITSARLASQQKGRFKNFNKTYNITSINELREVFDKDILTVLEGISIIDFNQGTRLKSCLEMRNHSGHPGEAPITLYNVMSFFSDIFEIVLLNPKFT